MHVVFPPILLAIVYATWMLTPSAGSAFFLGTLVSMAALTLPLSLLPSSTARFVPTRWATITTSYACVLAATATSHLFWAYWPSIIYALFPLLCGCAHSGTCVVSGLTASRFCAYHVFGVRS